MPTKALRVRSAKKLYLQAEQISTLKEQETNFPNDDYLLRSGAEN